jgi:branched-chain amino acid transport system substrate-binding protein
MATLAVASLALAACGAASSGSSNSASPAGPFVPTTTIAVSAGLSGAFAQYGQPFAQGAQIAADYLKQQGKANLTLKDQDSAGDPATAVPQLRNDATAGINFVASYDPSPVALACGPIAQRDSILYLASAVAANVPQSGSFIYQGPDSTAGLVASNMIPELQKLGAKRIAIAVDDDDFGTSTGDLIQQDAEAAGITVATYQKWDPTGTSFATTITNIENAHVDAVASSSVAATGALFAKQARAAGLDIPMISGSGWDSPQFQQLAGNSITGVYAVTDFIPTGTSPIIQTFVSMYKAKYGTDPDTNAASGFDAILILASAMDQAKSIDPNAVRIAMETVSVDGVTGSGLHFNAQRSIQKQDIIVTNSNGQWVQAP